MRQLAKTKIYIPLYKILRIPFAATYRGSAKLSDMYNVRPNGRHSTRAAGTLTSSTGGNGQYLCPPISKVTFNTIKYILCKQMFHTR